MKKLFIVLLLAGCNVPVAEITKAEEICKNNKGIQYIEPAIGNWFSVKCSDGAYFENVRS